jgi:hypothetical protein
MAEMSDWDASYKIYELGTITEDEYLTWRIWEGGTGADRFYDNPENKATYEKVQGLIDEYDSGNEPDLDVDDFSTIDQPDGKPKDIPTDLPVVVNTTGESGGDVSVSIEALKQFSTNVGAYKVHIDRALTALNNVSVKPGVFGAGQNLVVKVQGRGETIGLKGDTEKFLKAVNALIYDLQTDIGNLILEYDTTEEWNTMTTNQLSEAFNESFSNFSTISNYGNVSSEGESTSGGDSEGDNESK